MAAREARFATSVGIGQEHDDNLFFSASEPEADFVTQATAVINGEYESAHFNLATDYSITAERYADHPELDSSNARQRAAFGMNYRPSRRSEVFVDGEYAETNSPGELSPETGLAFGRVRATRVAAASGFSWRFGSGVTGTLRSSSTRDMLEGAADAATYNVSTDIENRFSERNTGHIAFESRRFDFDTGSTVTARIISAGWTARLTRRTTMTLDAGRYTSGETTKPEGAAMFRHDYRNGSMSIRYARRQSVVAGHSEPVDTESLAIMIEYTALPGFAMRVAPGIVNSVGSDRSTEIRRLDVEAVGMLAQSVALVARLRLARQEGAFVAFANPEFARNTVFVGLAVTFDNADDHRKPLDLAGF